MKKRIEFFTNFIGWMDVSMLISRFKNNQTASFVLKTTNFSIPNKSGEFYLILSGYGVYDLNDWTSRESENVFFNIALTRVARALLLLGIIPNQSYKGVDQIGLVINSATTSTTTEYYGYGDYKFHWNSKFQ